MLALSKNEKKKFKQVCGYIIKINLLLIPHSRGKYLLLSWASFT